MKLLTTGLLTCSLACLSLPVMATTYQLNNVKFDDGGTLNGTFNFDLPNSFFIPGQYPYYSNWNLTASGGDTTTVPPFTYTPANSKLSSSKQGLSESPTGLGLDTSSSGLSLSFSGPLTGQPGDVETVTISSSQVEVTNIGQPNQGIPTGNRVVIAGGSVSAIAAVPEPAEIGLYTIIPLLMGLRLRRRY